MLAALELGLVGGLVAAAIASALLVASGTLAPAMAAIAVGAVAGRFSDQMRTVLAREQRLLEQRTGFGRLLDAQEDDRRRHADTLHEELAQVLAAVLLNLRMLRRQGLDEASFDELHGQVVSVLDEVRHVATELRPSSLAQLGLVPALEALEHLSVEAAGFRSGARAPAHGHLPAGREPARGRRARSAAARLRLGRAPQPRARGRRARAGDRRAGARGAAAGCCAPSR